MEFIPKILIKPKGLTMVEILIYIAIFGLFFSTLVGFLFTVADNNRKAGYRKDIIRNITLTTEHLIDTFKVSTSIDTANSTFNSNNGRISLNSPTNTYIYNISANRIQLDKSGQISYLTESKLKVERFYLEEVRAANGTAIGARMTLELSSVKYPNLKNSVTTMFSIK
jgi:hypothetical protein